jgi:hypothetical protein
MAYAPRSDGVNSGRTKTFQLQFTNTSAVQRLCLPCADMKYIGHVTERVIMRITTAHFDGPMARSRNLGKSGSNK